MYIADWFNTRLNHSVTRRIFWKKKVLEEINFKTQGQAMFFLAHPFVITVYTVFSVFLSKNYLSISSSMATHKKMRKNKSEFMRFDTSSQNEIVI